MRTLVQKFLVYAAVVLATLTALAAKASTLSSRIDVMRDAAINAAKGYTDGKFDSIFGWVNDLQGTLSLFVTNLDNKINQVRANLEATIAGINFNVFGGRTGTQWETYIANQIGTTLDSAEARIKAMKEVSDTIIVKLADYTGSIPFASIATAPAAGNATTIMYKFQAPLGATAQKRNVTGLPASYNGSTTIEVDNGDEIFVMYAADGSVTIVGYDDNEAAVVAGVLNTQAQHGTSIADLESDTAALSAAFDSQSALVQTLLDQINGGSYYYAGGSGIGTGQLG